MALLLLRWSWVQYFGCYMLLRRYTQEPIARDSRDMTAGVVGADKTIPVHEDILAPVASSPTSNHKVRAWALWRIFPDTICISRCSCVKTIPDRVWLHLAHPLDQLRKETAR